jgi:hypothetical protein
MHKLIQSIVNVAFLYSPYYFEDGSRLSHVVQFDILRYQTNEKPRRIVDIGLLYDASSGLLRIDTTETWKWRDPKVPLNLPSQSERSLTESEKSDLKQKLSIFLSKHPRKYEPLVVV